MMMARLLSLAVLVAAAAVAQDDGGPERPDINYDNMPGFGDNPCPNFRCSGGYVPVQKARAKFESRGCGSMGAGMMMMGKGLDGDEPYVDCCHQWHACYQTCGSVKKSCDETFKPCAKAMCNGDADCEKQVDMNSMMMNMGGCGKFDKAQQGACECIVERKVEEKRAGVLRSFYKKYSPGNVDKAESLAKKADSTGKFAALLLKLVAKYPKSIKKIEDQEQKMYQNMMKDRPKEDDEEADLVEEVLEEPDF